MNSINSNDLLNSFLPDSTAKNKSNDLLRKLAGTIDKANGGNKASSLQISMEAQRVSSSILFMKDSENAVYKKFESFDLKLNISFSKNGKANYSVAGGDKDIKKMQANEGKKTKNDKKYSDEVEKLDKMLGEWNSDKTSDRIVDFAKAMYEAMLANDGGTENNEKLEKFKNMLVDAIDQGFGEAKQELGDIPDVIAELQQKTRDLIGKKLDDYFSKRSKGLDSGDNNSSSQSSESLSIEIYYEKSSIEESSTENENTEQK